MIQEKNAENTKEGTCDQRGSFKKNVMEKHTHKLRIQN